MAPFFCARSEAGHLERDRAQVAAFELGLERIDAQRFAVRGDGERLSGSDGGLDHGPAGAAGDDEALRGLGFELQLRAGIDELIEAHAGSPENCVREADIVVLDGSREPAK